MSDIDISSFWPEWEIEKKIGRGGYGEVYKAVRRDMGMDLVSAIKHYSIPQDESEQDSLHPGEYTSEDVREYTEEVRKEIQLMESIKGASNVVNIEDYRVIEKKEGFGWDIYIRMEYLMPFTNYIAGKKLSVEEINKLGVDICTALEFCSTLNMIHRDVKPANIFYHSSNAFKLGDFGAGRKMDNTSGYLTTRAGSDYYMAPEVYDCTKCDAPYDKTVDLYSLGLMLYELMNNRRFPFLDPYVQILNNRARDEAFLRRMRGDKFPLPADAQDPQASKYVKEMGEVILCACDPDPRKRFASASEMKRALTDIRNGVYESGKYALNVSGPGFLNEIDLNATKEYDLRKSINEQDTEENTEPDPQQFAEQISESEMEPSDPTLELDPVTPAVSDDPSKEDILNTEDNPVPTKISFRRKLGFFISSSSYRKSWFRHQAFKFRMIRKMFRW